MFRTLVTLYEHQFISYMEIFHDPKNKQRQDEILSEIEHVNETAGHDLLTLKRNGLCAGSWVGLINIVDISFQILPKIDYWSYEKNGEDYPVQPVNKSIKKIQLEKRAIENLLYMISYAYGISIDHQKITFLQEVETNWFDLLAYFFAEQLSEQIPSGLSRDYVSTEERSPMLHGRWDIQRQLRDSQPNQHQFNVIYEQYTQDTPLNQVFRFVLDRLLLLVLNNETRNHLHKIQMYFSNVALKDFIPLEFLNSIQINRLNDRYASAFSLARIFLSERFVNPLPGHSQSPAFTINMNVLFERFLTGFLIAHQEEILSQFFPESKITSQSEGQVIYLAAEQGRNKIRLQPDLLLTNQPGTKTFLIADTKYKQISLREKGILSDDIYQMVTYAVRLKCNQLLLLYPQSARSKPIRITYHIPSIAAVVYISTVNLHQPLNNKEGLINELREIFSQVIAA
jgi:5-methylcytosine-specific restriction enzyme subunit McrC